MVDCGNGDAVLIDTVDGKDNDWYGRLRYGGDSD